MTDTLCILKSINSIAMFNSLLFIYYNIDKYIHIYNFVVQIFMLFSFILKKDMFIHIMHYIFWFSIIFNSYICVHKINNVYLLFILGSIYKSWGKNKNNKRKCVLSQMYKIDKKQSVLEKGYKYVFKYIDFSYLLYSLFLFNVYKLIK